MLDLLSFRLEYYPIFFGWDTVGQVANGNTLGL